MHDPRKRNGSLDCIIFSGNNSLVTIHTFEMPEAGSNFIHTVLDNQFFAILQWFFRSTVWMTNSHLRYSSLEVHTKKARGSFGFAASWSFSTVTAPRDLWTVQRELQPARAFRAWMVDLVLPSRSQDRSKKSELSLVPFSQRTTPWDLTFEMAVVTLTILHHADVEKCKRNIVRTFKTCYLIS